MPQDQVIKRMCTKCGLYLASIESKSEHAKSCGDDVVTMVSPTTSTVVSVPREKVRPVRIASRRGRELMCVMEIHESEWQDIDDVDTTDIDIPEGIFPASGTPTIDIANVEPIWCDEEGKLLGCKKPFYDIVFYKLDLTFFIQDSCHVYYNCYLGLILKTF